MLNRTLLICKNQIFHSRKIKVFVFSHFYFCSMEGMNSSILAYGSTGSGKTFTILGDEEVEKKIMKNKSLESIIEEQA